MTVDNNCNCKVTNLTLNYISEVCQQLTYLFIRTNEYDMQLSEVGKLLKCCHVIKHIFVSDLKAHNCVLVTKSQNNMFLVQINELTTSASVEDLVNFFKISAEKSVTTAGLAHIVLTGVRNATVDVIDCITLNSPSLTEFILHDLTAETDGAAEYLECMKRMVTRCPVLAKIALIGTEWFKTLIPGFFAKFSPHINEQLRPKSQLSVQFWEKRGLQH